MDGRSDLLRLPRRFGPWPAVVVSWLWLGLSAMLLVYLGSLLPLVLREPVLHRAHGELWRQPILLALPMQQAFLLVNCLFVLYLWVTYRGHRQRRSWTVMAALPCLGPGVVMLLVQWAFRWLEGAVPQLYLIQVHP